MKYFFFDCDYNLRTWNFVTLKLQICRKKVPGKKGFVSIFFDSVLFLEWAVKRIAWVLSFSQQLVKKCIHSAIKNRSWHLLGMVIWSPCSNNTCSLCISEVFIYNLCVRLTAGGQTAYHQGPAMVRDSGAKASTVNVSGPGKGLTMKPRLMDSSTTLLVEVSLVVWITLSPPPLLWDSFLSHHNSTTIDPRVGTFDEDVLLPRVGCGVCQASLTKVSLLKYPMEVQFSSPNPPEECLPRKRAAKSLCACIQHAIANVLGDSLVRSFLLPYLVQVLLIFSNKSRLTSFPKCKQVGMRPL